MPGIQKRLEKSLALMKELKPIPRATASVSVQLEMEKAFPH